MTQKEKRKGNLTWSSWNNIIGRCLNPRGSGYEMYGAKGITICQRWRCYKNFLADMGERPPGTSIERIDGRKGYEPGNCKWATIMEQASNTKSNVLLTAKGETLHLQGWSRKMKINPCTIKYRIQHGWSVEDAIFTPAITTRGDNFKGSKFKPTPEAWPPPAHNRYMDSLK